MAGLALNGFVTGAGRHSQQGATTEAYSDFQLMQSEKAKTEG